jgi:site-specific recombinase XerD
MRPVPDDILRAFETLMEKKAVSASFRQDYRKWLRYFLDFRAKYSPPDARSEQVRLFIEKLQSKGQSQQQLNQAAQAVSLFFATQPRKQPLLASESPSRRRVDDGKTIPALSVSEDARSAAGPIPASGDEKSLLKPGRRYNELRFREKTKSPEWDTIIERLEAEIMTRHYSRKTLTTYANWIRKYQHYLKNKPPARLSPEDVKDYLTHLAVQCRVAASTQNQAFVYDEYFNREGARDARKAKEGAQ